MGRTKGTKATSGQKAESEAAGDGAALIITLADQTLLEKGPKVLEKLVENALNGHATSARLLVDWSARAGQLKTSDKQQAGISLASKWLAEPEWVGEPDESWAEMAVGSREPEG